MTIRPLSAHIGYLFTELPLPQRPAAARAAGFTAIEHPQPFAIPGEEMARILDGEGLIFAQMAAGTGDPARGEKGIAALPGREAEFLASLKKSLAYAEVVACPLVHPMAGVPGADTPSETVAATYRANLAAAVDACRERPVSILIEAISHAAVPNYHLSTLDHALAVADDVAPEEISLLLDTYHAAANRVDPVAFIEAHAARLGHIHIADHPGRHEPGTGKIAFAPILAALRNSGYDRAVGFEYIPATTTAEGLGWVSQWTHLVAGG